MYGELISTAMTISAPMLRTTSTGRLLVKPPSTSKWLPCCTAANAPGTAILARIAVARSPLAITTSLPLPISVAIALNGIGNLSKSVTVLTGSVSSLKTSENFCPCMAPVGNLSSPLSVTPGLASIK
ncbi:hypothetical protein D3C71_519130 [compost metagenome]